MGRTLGAWFSDNLENRRRPTWAYSTSDWMMGLTVRVFAHSEGTKLNDHRLLAFCELITVQDT